MTKQELATELRRVAQEMINLGVSMDYYGSFDDELARHGREMVGAGMIAQNWANELSVDSEVVLYPEKQACAECGAGEHDMGVALYCVGCIDVMRDHCKEK